MRNVEGTGTTVKGLPWHWYVTCCFGEVEVD